MASRIQTEHIVADSELKLANNQLARTTRRLCLALARKPRQNGGASLRALAPTADAVNFS
jgi:hypothetical protein